MAEVLVFHHALGLTPGVVTWADELRAAGHVVTTPDLFDGERFGSIGEGMAHVSELGFGTVIERGRLAAEPLPAELFYVGFSLGVLPAQMLAQTRPGARGAVLAYSCVPVGEFGPWPAGLPFQVHAMADDPLFVDEGDLEAARDLVAAQPQGELALYPGSDHYFADASLPTYDEAAATELTRRVLVFLGGQHCVA